MRGRGAAVVIGVLIAGCRDAEVPGRKLDASMVPLAEVMACAADSIRPATAAPAEGLWIYQDPESSEQVAAMIGPVRPADREPRVARSVETVETRNGAPPIRHRVTDAGVRLELLPPFRYLLGSRGRGTTFADEGPQPAAVYSLGTSVTLASYEPCGVRVDAPRLRYLRRDAAGRLVVDVMLRRESGDS